MTPFDRSSWGNSATQKIGGTNIYSVEHVKLLNGGQRYRAVHGDAGVVNQQIKPSQERCRLARHPSTAPPDLSQP